jgi:predicted Zn-dependent peptidase
VNRRAARRRTAFVAVLLAAGQGLPAAGCAGSPASPGGPALPGGTASTDPVDGRARPAEGNAPPVVIVPEDGPVVAAAVVVPGSSWELPGTEGLTLLTARTLLEQVRPRLDSLGARAGVQCGRAAFTFTLLAPADAWSTALRGLLDAVFRPDPTDDALQRARRSLRETLVLDRASPAWQARLAVRQALHGDAAPASAWSAPECGVPETLDLFDLADIRAGAHRFGPGAAAAALLGPVPSDADTLVRRYLPPGPVRPLEAPRGTRPGRRFVEQNTVTAWTALAFPFGPDADTEAIRLLGAVLESEVAPDPSRPWSYAVGSAIDRHGRGGVLIVHVVTETDSAARAARAVTARVAAVAQGAFPSAAFERSLRAHRGRRLLEGRRPERRAAAVALAAALGGEPGTGWPAVWDLTEERLREAAGSLGEPARAVVGPASAWGVSPP